MQPFHGLSAQEAARLLHTDLDRGLSAFEAAERLGRDGPNRLTAQKGKGAFRRFLDQFTQPLIVILIIAAGVSVLLGDWVDSGVIAGVVLVNALIGFLQEHRAEQAIAALDALVVTEATVIRDGRRRRIAGTDLVVGDLIWLQPGDAVPADLRLVQVRDLQTSEAALTGESVPSHKGTEPVEAEANLGDRTCMAFAGTTITFGTALGLVVATGDRTETGRIAGMIASSTEIATPLTRRIAAFSKLLLWIILGVAAGLFALEMLRGTPLSQTFNTAVALAVSAIPEGLPAAVTVLLAVGVSHMARRRALIRRLPAVETLGSTTVICSDKTGTLTENQMTVTRLWTGNNMFQFEGAGYGPAGQIRLESGEIAPPEKYPELVDALRCGAICNDTRIVREAGETRVEGDPTEAALIVAAEKGKVTAETQGWRRIDEIPFASEHMYMAVLAEDPVTDRRTVWAKGSYEAIGPMCGSAPEGFPRQVEQMASQGLRTLALAYREFSGKKLTRKDLSNLTFLGVVGMIDPPRPAAQEAVRTCHRAGIRVKMITGDHAVTAAAIAAQIGIEGSRDTQGQLRSVTGRELAALSPKELQKVASEVSVFARVAPEQKLQLVRALQAEGHIVAMTGDGVNDAPALEQADIGIAMGKGGTDVARGAAAMILTDDNFATIEAAIEEGRGVYDNLVKFVTWTLPTNGGEALVLLSAVLLGTALPILPVQILWINMATAIFLGIALVFEPKEPGLMDRPPRRAKEPILTPVLGLRTLLLSVVIAGAAFAVFQWKMGREGETSAYARTLAVNMIVVIEVAYLFSCRSLRLPIWRLGVLSNPWVWLGAGVMLSAQLAFTYLPIMNRLFHTEPIEPIWWLYYTVVGAGVFIGIEFKKALN